MHQVKVWFFKSDITCEGCGLGGTAGGQATTPACCCPAREASCLAKIVSLRITVISDFLACQHEQIPHFAYILTCLLRTIIVMSSPSNLPTDKMNQNTDLFLCSSSKYRHGHTFLILVLFFLLPSFYTQHFLILCDPELKSTDKSEVQ